MNTDNGLVFEDFRRTVKTNMLTAGINKEYRDTILGHSLKGMDRHYIVPDSDELAQAMNTYTDWLDEQVAGVLKSVDQIVDQANKKGLKKLAKLLK